MLLGHRYYDASLGRFLSSDPAQAGSNWYAYCDNNPLVRVDPTGLIPFWKEIVEGAKDVARDISIDKIKDGVNKMWRRITKSKDDVEKSIEKGDDDIRQDIDNIRQDINDLRQEIQQQLYEMEQRIIDYIGKQGGNATGGSGTTDPPPPSEQDGVPEGFIGPNGQIIGGDGTVEIPIDL